jgi:hypothetical protein
MKNIFILFLFSLICFAANSQAITLEVPGDPAFMTVEEAKAFGMHPESDSTANVVVNVGKYMDMLSTNVNAGAIIGDVTPKLTNYCQPVKCDLLVVHQDFYSLIMQDKTRETLTGFTGTN